MKSVLDRVRELAGDPSLAHRGMTTMSSLAFKPVGETMTGEEIAVILACLVAQGSAGAAARLTQSQQGNVHTATFNDGIEIKDVLGG